MMAAQMAREEQEQRNAMMATELQQNAFQQLDERVNEQKARELQERFNREQAQAVANAANAEPIWCEEKIHPNNTGPFTGPKNCPANRTVGGTVAIKSNPKKIAHKVNEKTSKSLYGNQISDNPRKP